MIKVAAFQDTDGILFILNIINVFTYIFNVSIYE